METGVGKNNFVILLLESFNFIERRNELQVMHGASEGNTFLPFTFFACVKSFYPN